MTDYMTDYEHINRGSAIKMKEDTHKMAESNRSYAHFSSKKKSI